MLDLMSFKKEFVTQCRSVLNESGPQGMKIEECKMKKAQRGELNGLLFRKEGLECAPTLYVEDFYKAYKDGSAIRDLSHAAIESVVSNLSMAETLAGRTGRMLDENIESSFADQEFLCVHLLNMSRNKEYLKGIPFRELGGGFVFIAEIGCGEYGADGGEPRRGGYGSGGGTRAGSPVRPGPGRLVSQRRGIRAEPRNHLFRRPLRARRLHHHPAPLLYAAGAARAGEAGETETETPSYRPGRRHCPVRGPRWTLSPL